jgi:hypothetical protein
LNQLRNSRAFQPLHSPSAFSVQQFGFPYPPNVWMGSAFGSFSVSRGLETCVNLRSFVVSTEPEVVRCCLGKPD